MNGIVNRKNSSPQGELKSFKYSSPSKHDIPIAAPADKLGFCGKWLRHKLLDAILVGTPVVLAIQKRRTPAWTRFMKAASFLGTEDFYTILFVLLLWIFDSRFARLFVLLMGVGFYVTGFFKTFLCLPRPPNPHVRPLEKAYDWALPSHHCLLGTVLPWYIWMYINIHYKLSTYQLVLWFIVIFLWSFNVLVSRLYLGVHSPADVVSAGILGVLILFLWVPVDDIVDHYISQQSTDIPIQVAILFIFLVLIHPSSDPGNPSLRDSCILIGVSYGVIYGHSQRTHTIGHLALLETIPPNMPILLVLLKCCGRILSGGVFVFILRMALKKVLHITIGMGFKGINLPYYSGRKFRRSNDVFSKHYTQDFKITPLENEAATIKPEKPGSNDIQVASDSFNLGDLVSSENSNNAVTTEFKKIYSLWQQRSTRANFLEFYIPAIPVDIDILVTLSLYPILTYCVFVYLPRIFSLCNL